MAVTWNCRCVLWGIMASITAVILAGLCWSTGISLAIRIAAGVGSIPLGFSSVIAFHISSLRCSHSHTLFSLLACYALNERGRTEAFIKMSKAVYMWRHPREAQENLIRRLTRQHSKTEYGRRNRLDKIRSLHDLRELHPLTTYRHFEDYIQRLADGEQGAFLNDAPVRFGVTSGTTGPGKLIPFGGFFFAEEAFCLELLRLATYQGSSQPSPVQKRCLLYTHPRVSYTKTGLVVSPYTLLRDKDVLLIADHSSPPPAFAITDESTASYIHMLFAIADANLAVLGSVFIWQLCHALESLESLWEAMVGDLSTGKLSDNLPLAPEMRRSIGGYLRADQERATQLRREFEKGFDGIVRRIWPHLVALQGIDTSGSHKKRIQKYSKGVICVSGYYMNTESGILALNMWTHEDVPRYVLQPQMAVFEFLPIHNSSENGHRSLLIDEVQVGRKYELVVTTRTGLYRYRTGDVIQVTSFHENCPVITFMYRTEELLNLVDEKVSPREVAAAISQTMTSWPGLQLVDWTSAESTLYDPGNPEMYYALFLEVNMDGELKITEEDMSKFDECLQTSHHRYRNLRSSSTISKARVHFVRRGTFGELWDVAADLAPASTNQYRPPRKLRAAEQMELMRGRLVDANRQAELLSQPTKE